MFIMCLLLLLLLLLFTLSEILAHVLFDSLVESYILLNLKGFV
jgi:hypothetical protein